MSEKSAKCPVCGKIYTGAHCEGSLRFHMQAHGVRYPKKKKEEVETHQQDNESDEGWRWLNRNVPHERKAMRDGHMEINTDTGYLR